MLPEPYAFKKDRNKFRKIQGKASLELQGPWEHPSIHPSFMLSVQAESQPQGHEAVRAMLKRL